MKIVKLSSNVNEPLLRQTPGSAGVWNDCRFLFGEAAPECDWWVVFEGIDRAERTRCPRNNTIFITGEPSAIRSYHPGFLKQFGIIITTQPEISGRGVRRQQPGMNWHVGQDRITKEVFLTYDDLSSINAFPKTRLMSIVCSSKRMCPGHLERLDFVNRLIRRFGSDIDVFGAEHNNYIPDKWDAIFPYKYHIAIENSRYPNYWTEKLADAYLGGAYPIYCGCPNLTDYFPEESFSETDITDPDSALRTIESVLEDDPYERSFDKIMEARELVLNKYNLFSMLAEITSEREEERKKLCQIKPESEFVAGETVPLRLRKALKRPLAPFVRRLRAAIDKNS